MAGLESLLPGMRWSRWHDGGCPGIQVELAIASRSRRYPGTTPPGRLIAERVREMGHTLRVASIIVETGQGTDLQVITADRSRGKRQ